MASPRATATRWRMPPESSRGRFQVASLRFTRAMNSSVTRLRGRRVLDDLCGRRHSPVDRVHGEGDVVVDAHPGKERVLLEDDPPLGAGLGHRGAVQHDGAGVGGDEAGDKGDERRLAGAGIADDGHELPVLQGEVDAAQHAYRPRRRAECLLEAPNLEVVAHVVLKRDSTSPMSRSRMNPIAPMVMTERMMCE